MKHTPRVAWLLALWLLLWRDLSVANVASGVVVAVAVEAGATRSWATPTVTHGVRLLALAHLLVYFAYKLVEANVYLAREIVTPTNQIRTGIIAVPMTGCSRFVATVVANAVTLTPGTLTLEMRHGEVIELYVHVLHLHDIERARGDVQTFAELTLRAFPPTSIDAPPKDTT